MSLRNSIRSSKSSAFRDSPLSADTSSTTVSSGTPTHANRPPNLQLEIDQLEKALQRQTFWKYHVMRIGPQEFYLTTTPDKRHRLVRSGPSYFVKLDFPNDANLRKSGDFRLTIKQQSSNSPPIMVDKSQNGFKATCYNNEYQRGPFIQNDELSSLRKMDYIFKQGADSVLKESISCYNNYTMGENAHVCQLKDQKNYLFKSKIDGVKLGKDGSIYFMDDKFSGSQYWFDPVIAFFRPCNRAMKNKITRSVMKSSRLSLGGSNGINTKKLFSSGKINVDFSNLALKQGSGGGSDSEEEDGDAEDQEDEEDDEDEDEEDGEGDEGGDQPKIQKFYLAHDGLYSRHPMDDSPNDFKLGWLTIYEKNHYFEKRPNGGNWELVLALTLALAVDVNRSKIAKDL